MDNEVQLSVFVLDHLPVRILPQVDARYLPLAAFLGERHFHRAGLAVGVGGCALQAALVVGDVAGGKTPARRLECAERVLQAPGVAHLLLEGPRRQVVGPAVIAVAQGRHVGVSRVDYRLRGLHNGVEYQEAAEAAQEYQAQQHDADDEQG